MARKRDPSFFTILLGDHFCHKLKIPGAFLGCFDGNVPEQFRLRTPARTWVVAVEKVDHKYYFQKGWSSFVHDNGFKVKEVLVFRYTGNSDFSVDIYGKNTCKKVFGMATRKESDCLRSKDVDYPMEEADEDVDPSVELLDDLPPCRTTRGDKFELPSPLPHIDGLLDYKDDKYDENVSVSEEHESEEEDENENLNTEENETEENVDYGDEDSDEENEDEDEDSESKNENEDQDEDHYDDDDDDVSIEILSEKPPCWKTGGKFPLGISQLRKSKGICSKTEAQSNIKAVGGSSRTASFLKQRHKVPKNMHLATKVRKLDPLERAMEFKSKSQNPCVVIPMCATYAAGNYLNIPREFAKRHLRKQPNHAIFRANGVSRTVKFHNPHNQIYRTRVGFGWHAFARINDIKETDVCVFVLTDNIKLQFSVEIFRSTDDANSTLPSPGEDEDSDEQNEGEDEGSEAKNEKEDQDEDHYDDDDDDDDDVSVEFLREKPPCWKTGGEFPLGSQLHKSKGICSKTEAQRTIKAVGGSSRTASFLKPRHKIPKKTHLATKFRKLDPLERALEFESKSLNPCVVIPMRAAYAAGNYLNIPREFAKRHLRKQPDHAIFRANGVSQNVDLHYYPSKQRTYDTRVSAGWYAFARINNLKESDVCVLVLTDNAKFQFSVEIFRSTDAANSTLPSPGGRQQAAVVRSNSKNSKRKLNGRSIRI